MKKLIRFKIIRHFLKSLNNLQHGTLILTTPRGVTRRYIGTHEGTSATFTLHSWDVIINAGKRGDIGLGEDYIDGLWESEDIGALIELFLRNMQCFEDFAHGNILNRAAFRIINALRRNSKTQSKKNIQAHYDVGNEFYQLWLDDTMTYSSAIYQDDNADLQTAQTQKYQRILNCLEEHHNGNKDILEIGSGWGGFAQAAAEQQHNITTLTISPSQYDFAEKRLQNAGLLERVKLKLEDYRESTGLFDAIVSIEMFEAVGERYWPDYFSTLKQRLKQNGKAVIQTITIDDGLFEDYRTRSDFIRQYTFPGGMLPSMQRFREEAETAGLSCHNVYTFGCDYAKTLKEWLHRFDTNRDKIIKMGYSDAFIRSWRFYLSMCIGAFAANRTNVVQVELVHAS